MEKIKLFEAFAGYGGASFALRKANIPFECVGYSEIEPNAVKCYKQNHEPITNYGDITKIDEKTLPDFDLFTGGFPCQAFSTAGRMNGELDTRGTLFNDIIRICEFKQPKYIVLENVKGLTMKKFESTFNKIISELGRIGYAVYWQIMNTKDYNIPQNRERIIFVCIRRDVLQLKHNGHYFFPSKEPLTLLLNDILEKEISPIYYPSEKAIAGVMRSNYRDRKPLPKDSKWMKTIKLGGDIARIEMDGVVPFRSLTEKEYFRLQGFVNDECKYEGISRSKVYDLAGNGWSINVFERIFHNLLGDTKSKLY